MENDKNILEIIDQFKSLTNISLNLFTSVPKTISEKDRLITDYEHKLEFKSMDHAEHFQTMLDLERAMRERRESKDLLYIYEPIYKFMINDSKKEMIDDFLTEIDKVYASTQQRIANLVKRKYTPRVLDEEPFGSQSSIIKDVSKYNNIDLDYKPVKSDIVEEYDETENIE